MSYSTALVFQWTFALPSKPLFSITFLFPSCYPIIRNNLLRSALPYVVNIFTGLLRSTTLLDGVIYGLQYALKKVARVENSHVSQTLASYSDLVNHAITLDEESLDADSLQSPHILSVKYFEDKIMEKLQPIFRFSRSMRFLLATWIHQLSVSDRAIVLLSILRDLPLLDADRASTLHKQKKPTLIFWGEEDGILPLEQTSKFQEKLPHAVIVRVPSADHAAFLQKPHQIFNQFLDFIKVEANTAT